MKRTPICCLSIFASFILALNALGQDGFQGTIFFRNGDSVQFDRIGDLQSVTAGSRIEGNLGSQKVNYPFSNLKEIVFADSQKSYYPSDSSRGTIIITNRYGERFTITNACVFAGDWSRINYVYQDPVIKAVKATSAVFLNNISHIVIGDKVGDMKRNPKTGEYFPALYLYDPFTGESLEWATRK